MQALAFQLLLVPLFPMAQVVPVTGNEIATAGAVLSMTMVCGPVDPMLPAASLWEAVAV